MQSTNKSVNAGMPGKTGRKAKRSIAKDGPMPMDVHVGSRVRLRRTLMGLSQEKLGDAIGLTFQQVQKYERGMNRISASKLHHLSNILDVPVSYFFDDFVEDGSSGSKPQAADSPTGIDPMSKRETLELVRTYYRIEDPAVRRKAYDLIKALAREPSEGVA